MLGIARFFESLGCQPSLTFCCGCPVSHGVLYILFFHFLACLFQIITAFFTFVLHLNVGGASLWGASASLAICGLHIAGIPIILMAVHGVYTRHAASVWIYFSYLALCVILDITTLVSVFWLQDACDTMNSVVELLGHDFGEAYVCGCVRVWAVAFVTTVITIEIYCLFTIWSYCEDVHLGTIHESIEDLLISPGSDHFNKKNRRHKSHDDPDIIVHHGHANHQKAHGPYPSPYGAVQQCSYPHYPVLGGKDHTTDYPPNFYDHA